MCERRDHNVSKFNLKYEEEEEKTDSDEEMDENDHPNQQIVHSQMYGIKPTSHHHYAQ